MMPTFKITSEDQGERLDVVLARAYPKVSRSFLQKVVKRGGVTLRGSPATTSYRVRAGDIFQVIDWKAERAPSPHLFLDGDEQSKWIPRVGEGGLPSPAVIFEDDFLLVLDKPPRLVVHPATGHHGDTLIDWLRHHLGPQVVNRFIDGERLGLVHRLDKDTSGVLLVAKSVEAQTAISRQFRERTIQKTYRAFIEGIPSAIEGVISAPVARSRKNPARMAVSNYGRASETTFKVDETFKEASLVTALPKTGRTHQIRVHMAAIGHPIVGDRAYGSHSAWAELHNIKRSLLHAEKLQLKHPETEKIVSFAAPWPKDFQAAYDQFKKGLAVVVLGLCVGLLCSSAMRAEDSGSADAPVKKVHHASSGSSGGGASAASVRALKKDISAMKDDVDAIRSQVAVIQSSFDSLGATSRLHDLEHAVADLNAKTVSGNSSIEETKTQTLQQTRKIKELQEAIDQIRDQVDRLKTDLIQRRTQQDNATQAEPAATGTGK